MRVRYGLIFGSMVILMMFTAGCLEDEKDIPENNRYWIDSEADEFVFHQSLDKIDWDEWEIWIRNGNTTFILEPDQGGISRAGDKTIFKDPDGLWDPILGIEYNMKIIDTVDDKVMLEDDIIAQ